MPGDESMWLTPPLLLSNYGKDGCVNSQVCVDASFALKLILPESDSERAEALWQSWLDAHTEIIAPVLFVYETSSVLRNRVHRKDLTTEEGEEALTFFIELAVSYLHPPELRQLAWQLATQFHRPTVYDSFYLALAQISACPLWTADRRLYNAVKDELDWVYWIGA